MFKKFKKWAYVVGAQSTLFSYPINITLLSVSDVVGILCQPLFLFSPIPSLSLSIITIITLHLPCFVRLQFSSLGLLLLMVYCCHHYHHHHHHLSSSIIVRHWVTHPSALVIVIGEGVGSPWWLPIVVCMCGIGIVTFDLPLGVACPPQQCCKCPIVVHAQGIIPLPPLLFSLAALPIMSSQVIDIASEI